MANQTQFFNNFIEKLQETIQKNLGKPDLSIDHICTEMNVSRAQLHRKVKATTGLSTSLYIRKMRMEQAKLLLHTTSLNVSEIAYHVGITSPQNFSKYFIETYGISPSAYRKQQNPTAESPVETPVPVLPDPLLPDAPLPTSSSKRRIWLFGTLLLLIVAGIWILIVHYSKKAPPISNTIQTLAVLPFKNKATTGDEYLSKGMQEDILFRLKQLASLKMLPTASGKADTAVKNTATAVQPDYLLEGEWTKDHKQSYLTVRLIRVADKQQLWKKRYDSSRTNLAAIAGKTAFQVAHTLRLPLSKELAERMQYQPTTSAAAYRLVLQGKYLLQNRTRESLQASRRNFEQAIRLDSAYSDAYLGKANVLDLYVNMSYSDQKKEDIREAEQFALLAIKTNTNNAAAYAVLANIYSEQYRWQEALTAFQIALKLNPHDAFTNYWYGLALRSTGDLKQALHYHQVAYELDPTHPIIFSGYVYTAIFAKNMELAAQLLQQATPEFRQSFLYIFVRGMFYLAQEQYETAIPYFDTTLTMNPAFRSAQPTRSFCLGKLGKRQEVVTFIASLDTTRADDCLAAAVAYAGLEEIEKGVFYLKSAADKGKIPEYLMVDLRYAAFQQHPTFRKILEAYGLKPI